MGKKSGFWAVNREIADLNERVGILVERMILLRPKTPAEIAAVAASIKEDQRHFWKEPEIDRERLVYRVMAAQHPRSASWK